MAGFCDVVSAAPDEFPVTELSEDWTPPVLPELPGCRITVEGSSKVDDVDWLSRVS